MRNAIETKQCKNSDYFTIWFNILSNLWPIPLYLGIGHKFE